MTTLPLLCTAINVRDVTTKAKDDYSEEFAKQVQFNPGQSEQTWQLQLIDDSIYETKVGNDWWILGNHVDGCCLQDI